MSDEALESLYDPVMVTDAAGYMVHLNPAAEALFGHAEQAVGQAIGDVVPDPRIVYAIQRAVRQAAVSAGEGEADFIPLRAGEAERTYRLRATPMHDDDGSLLGAVAVLEDVTHLRQIDQLKNEFIGVASHELRTPVTSLLLAVQLMQEGSAGPLTPEQCDIVTAQRQDLERLQRMMRDLLDVTRLEAGMEPPRTEALDAEGLLKAAVDAVSAQAGAKNITLAAEGSGEPLAVLTDRAQMSRVLMNLLNNAVRHTPEGGRITAAASLQDGRVAFRVEDTGAGIPEEHLPRIFERFVQVPGATRGGVGLGLSIARTIVKAHGGTIVAESQVGRGSVFTVTLPATAKKETQDAKE
jgi:NtrC-family two-component system sensor histidine kinase KinB